MVYSSGKYKRYKRARSSSRKYKERYTRKYRAKAKYARRRPSQPLQPYGRWGMQSTTRALMAGAERKYTDSGISQSIVYDGAGAGSHVFLLNAGIAQGSGVSQRVGNKIKFVSIQLELSFYQQVTSVSQRLRCLVVHDNAPNGVSPTLSQILASVSNAAFSHMNLSFRERFRVVLEETFTLGGCYSVAVGDPPVTSGYFALSPGTANVSRFVKTDITTIFSDGAIGIGSIQSGAIYLLVLASRSASSAEGFAFQWATRMRYIDI